MIRRVVALGGPPGSGKTTAARALATELALTLVSAGERFRAEASRRGMALGAFSSYAESHPEVDVDLDEGLSRLAAPGALLEGRVQGPLLRKRGIPVHWLAVLADEPTRASRLAERDGIPLDESLRRMREREASERRRYLALYQIDLDRAEADFSVDSTQLPPAGVVAALAGYLRRAEADAPR